MAEVQKRRRSSVSLDAIKPYRRNGSTTAGSLHEHLRRLILDGAIPNGASISQVELAERLGVSRTPLREAMRTLSTYFDRAERLRRMFQTEEIAAGVRLNEEHEAILRACKAKNASNAAALVARHSARAALTLMAQISPEREPTLVRTALQLFSALESA